MPHQTIELSKTWIWPTAHTLYAFSRPWVNVQNYDYAYELMCVWFTLLGMVGYTEYWQQDTSLWFRVS